LNGNKLTLDAQYNGNPVFWQSANATVNVNLAEVKFKASNMDLYNPVIRSEFAGSNIVFLSGKNISLDLDPGKALVFDSRSTGTNRIEVRGAITGTGDVVKIGQGRLVFAQDGFGTNNSYAGKTFVNEGLLRLASTGSPTPGVAIPGYIRVGDDDFTNGTAFLEQGNSNQIADTAIVEIFGDGVYNLGTFVDRIGGLKMGSSVGGGEITGTGIIELAGDITINDGGVNPTIGSKIASRITLVNPITTMTVNPSSNNSGPDLQFNGVIDGAANFKLILDGGGRVEMKAVNTGGYTTRVHDGVLILNKNAGTGGGGSVPGNLVIGDGVGSLGSAEVRIAQSNAIADGALVTIEGDGVLTSAIVNGVDKIAGLASNNPTAQVNLGFFTLQIAPPGNFVYNGVINGDGRIEIVAPTGFALPGRQTFAGPINLSGLGFGPYSITVSGGPVLEILGPVTGGGGGISSTSEGSVDKIYLNSYAEAVRNFEFDFFYPGSFTVPGLAASNKIDFKGTFVTRIANPLLFGSLIATGEILNLGALRVELPTSYRPSVGEAFTILDVLDPSVRLAINGITFKGLPEGARLFDTTGTVEFQITYAGGDGNDVVLVNTGAPTVEVKRAFDQAPSTTGTTAAFEAIFSGPMQPIVPPGVIVSTTGTVSYETFQILQQSANTFRITVQGLSGNGSIALSLAQGAAFSLAGTPSQPSFSVAGQNIVIVNTGSGGGGPNPGGPSGGGGSGVGGLGFFGNVPGPRTLVGAGIGGGGQVNAYQVRTQPNGQFRMLDTAYTNGVRVATADFNRDGVVDYVVGSGPGGVSNVQVLDGKTGAVLFAVQPFESSFTGGVYVAVGDINSDGTPDLVITPDEGGGPRVQIYSGSNFVKIADFFGIDDPGFRGGARAAVGDLNGDGVADLVVAAGFGGGPRISIYDGKSLASGQIVRLTQDFFAFEPSLRNGTFVAVADINGDGVGDLVAGAGPGGAPRVTVFDGKVLASSGAVANLLPISNFFAGPETNRGGVPLGISDFNADRVPDLVTGTGVGEGSRVRVYPITGLTSANPPLIADFDAFPGFTGGVFVG
jgi:autotransporter-associated beta strand protein